MSVTIAPVETPKEEAVRKGPPHKVSPAATRAARILIDFIDLTVKPGEQYRNLLPDTRCLAIIIDLTSNIYHVCDIRPRLYYWQRRICSETATAPQIGLFLHELITALEKIYFREYEEAHMEYVIEKPMFLQSSSGGTVKIPVEPRHVISGPALAAANGIFNFYEVKWKTTQQTPKISQIAGIIDTTVHMYRAVRLLTPVRKLKQSIARGELTIQQIADQFKLIGVNLDYLPGYKDRDEQRQYILE